MFPKKLCFPFNDKKNGVGTQYFVEEKMVVGVAHSGNYNSLSQYFVFRQLFHNNV
jgi:hypothetical protein